MNNKQAADRAIKAMRDAYCAVDFNDIGYMATWELRDLLIEAVRREFRIKPRADDGGAE